MTDVDDSERVAMALLAEIKIGHPVLQMWVDTLLEEPFMTVSLDKFGDMPGVQDTVAEAARQRYQVNHIEASICVGQSNADESMVTTNKTDAEVYHLACALVARRCLEHGLESDGALENWERCPHLPDAINTYRTKVAKTWGAWEKRPLRTV